jgi:UDP-N-acetylglucosamine 2-epimerase
LGQQAYFSFMSFCACMVGNTSSGLIEAPSFQTPVVNIGDRQAGRLRAKNVIDSAYDRAAVVAAIRSATSSDFTAALKDLANPYGDGYAAARIVSTLRNVNLDDHLIRKRFHSPANVT